MGLCNPKFYPLRHLDESEDVKLDMFLFQSVLGEGGFGKVMLGYFVHKDTWYAVKSIRKHHILSLKTGEKMLYNELNSLKQLPPHPYICGLNYAFQDKLNCYFVLDLKRGGDLRHYLDDQHVLFNERDIAIYVSCLSNALDHMHRFGVIHRDVKPDNIILDSKGFPCLTDFGVSYVSYDKGKLSTTLGSGTKPYLAPEVFTKSHFHGPESDYWSLGIVAYEMLYGVRPFEKCPKNFVSYAELLLKERLASGEGIKLPQTKKRSLDETKESSDAASEITEYSNRSSSPGKTSDNADCVQSFSSETDDLPSSLRVTMNASVHTLEGDFRVSRECIDVLNGLLDVRTSSRFGCDNIGMLLNHPWFIECNKLNHTAILQGRDEYKPSFQPGQGFIRETCYSQSHYAQEDATLDYQIFEKPQQEIKANKKSENDQEPLSIFQQQKFATFHFCREPF